MCTYIYYMHNWYTNALYTVVDHIHNKKIEFKTIK